MASVNGNEVTVVDGIAQYTTPAGRVYHQHADGAGGVTKWHWATDSHRYVVLGHNPVQVNPYARAAVRKVNGQPFSTAIVVAQRTAVQAQAKMHALVNAAMVAQGVSYPALRPVAAPTASAGKRSKRTA